MDHLLQTTAKIAELGVAQAGGYPNWDERLINITELRRMIGSPATSTVYRWVHAGILPPAIKIGPNRVGWKISSIRQFIEQRAAA